MIKLEEGQTVYDEDGNEYLIEKGDFVGSQKLEEDFKEYSDIGYGTAEIYRGNYTDNLSVFKNVDEVYVAKDLTSGIEMSLKGKPVVLVTNSYRDILRAYPIVNGKIVNGMWDGSFIYTSNGVVMKGYSHPIPLQARVER